MKTSLILFIAAAYAVTACMCEDNVHSREKRNAFQFRKMIKDRTGREPLLYNGYGCWCGLGGRGKPKDGVDRCCRSHDYCYDRLRDNGCNPVISTYTYSLSGGIVCDSSENNSCQQGACECDRTAAYCFASNTFHKKYISWPNFLCR
ncbi:acidic phospholipase A2 PLA-1-like [Lingula anatina]|uniref:Phospholipase A2 n=1 Tax=Lingula anatina TaxID=7574 RepID=A0A1S3I8T3_LINAN|nr:acidic phospholipase A2 PLA-1-like [Lingula anatina]|eukprot:XP_013393799.1 acidic phospholipase A2 PLA-1-like [Lingula anatina]